MSDAASGPPSAPKSRKRKFKSAIDAVTFTQRCAQAAANAKHINLADISSLLEDNSAGAEYQQLMLSLAAKEDENRQLSQEKQQLARDYAKLQAAYALLQDELGYSKFAEVTNFWNFQYRDAHTGTIRSMTKE